MNPFIFVLCLFAVARSVCALNPYIPMYVNTAPKTSFIQCPQSCSSAKDCFFVHPLSESHFYSCFHGKALVHQCPMGKSYNDEKHQCVTQTKQSASNGRISNAKMVKLTEKIALLETLIESFQDKMNKVQKVILESDNKIGLLGKFLLKALRTNREQFCGKQSSETAADIAAVAQEAPAPAESDPDLTSGTALGGDDMPDQQQPSASKVDLQAEEDGLGEVQSSAKEGDTSDQAVMPSPKLQDQTGGQTAAEEPAQAPAEETSNGVGIGGEPTTQDVPAPSSAQAEATKKSEKRRIIHDELHLVH